MRNKTNKDIIEILNLFNKNANKIKNRSYAKFFLAEKPKTTISKKQGKPLKIKITEPDNESLDAFLLTLRLFYQEGEQISFRNTNKIYNINKIYENLPNNFQKEKKSFSRAIKIINSALDTNTDIKFNNKILTYREVLDTILYGNTAHFYPNRRNTIKSWKSKEGLCELYKTSFHAISISMKNFILYVQKINTDTIRKIKKYGTV